MAETPTSTKSNTSAGKKAAPLRSTTKAAVRKPVAAKASASSLTPAAPKAIKPAAKKEKQAQFTAVGELGKKELLEKIVAESGLKKGDARIALNAMLKVLHGALSEGKDISAAPLGKLRIARKKQTPNGELAVLRVKLKSDKVPE